MQIAREVVSNDIRTPGTPGSRDRKEEVVVMQTMTFILFRRSSVQNLIKIGM